MNLLQQYFLYFAGSQVPNEPHQPDYTRNRNEIVTMHAKPIMTKLSSEVFFMKNVTTEIPKKNKLNFKNPTPFNREVSFRKLIKQSPSRIKPK